MDDQLASDLRQHESAVYRLGDGASLVDRVTLRVFNWLRRLRDPIYPS